MILTFNSSPFCLLISCKFYVNDVYPNKKFYNHSMGKHRNFINPSPGASSPTRRGRSGFQERREIAYGTAVLLTTYILQPYKQKIACQRAVVAPAPPLIIALQVRKCHYPQRNPHWVPARRRVSYAADGAGGRQNACVARRTGSRSPLLRGGTRISANGEYRGARAPTFDLRRGRRAVCDGKGIQDTL